MRRRAAAPLLALALCAAIAGCASSRPPVVDFSEAAKNYRRDDYHTVFEAWTRHARLVQDVGTVMEIWATLKGWDFRQAYIARYAKDYDLADSERDALAKTQLETARAVYEIHLVAQSTNDRWTDFEKRSSPWRITLVDGTGAELAPSSLKAERLPDAYEGQYFPTRTPFSHTYTVRFVRPEGGQDASFVGPTSGRLILRVASPVGKVEVVWEAKN